jgi:3-hydroxyisobutyrate dehydrogenase
VRNYAFGLNRDLTLPSPLYQLRSSYVYSKRKAIVIVTPQREGKRGNLNETLDDHWKGAFFFMPELKVALIGTGLMGLPMARNLLKAGFAVTVFNRTRTRAEPLTGEGAIIAASPRDASELADVIITMVSDTPDVREVILGEQGVAKSARPGSTVIDMSTISPRATREIAAALADNGVEMLDAPVSGGEKGAIEATLSIMVGGKREVFEKCRPIFEAMGKKLVYCGGHGQGQMTKLCNQIAIATNLMAAAEAVTFAKKAGLDPLTMIEAVGAGAAGSWVINVLGPKMVNHDFAPGFMVKLQQKDLRLVMEAASELSVSLPGAALAHQLFAAVEAEGNGDLGTQSMIKVLEKLASL